MKLFIEMMNHGIWRVVKEGVFVPTPKINGVVEDKPEKD